MLAEAELRSLSRKELQACAKKHGVKANGSNEAIIAALLASQPTAQPAVAEEQQHEVAQQEQEQEEQEEQEEVKQEEQEEVKQEPAEAEADAENGFSEEQLSSLGRKELQALARKHNVKANGSNKAIIAALLASQTPSEPGQKEADEAAETQPKESVVVEMTLEEYLKASPAKPGSSKKKGKQSRGSKKSSASEQLQLPSEEEIQKVARLSAAAERLGSADEDAVDEGMGSEGEVDADAIAFTALRRDMKVMVQVGNRKKWVTIKRKSNTYVRVELENGDEEKLDDSNMFFKPKSSDGDAASEVAANSTAKPTNVAKKTTFAAAPTPVKKSTATIKSPLGRSTPGLGPAERKQVRPKVATPAIYRKPSIIPKKNRLAEVREELAKKRKSQAHQAMENKRMSAAHETFSKVTQTKIAGSNRPTKPAVTKPAARSKVAAAASNAPATATKAATATTPGKTPNFDRIHNRQFEAQPSIAEKGKRPRPTTADAQKRAPSDSTDADVQVAKRKKGPAAEPPQAENTEATAEMTTAAPGSANAVKKRRKSTVPQPFQLGKRENFAFKPYSGALPPAADTTKIDENQPPAAKNAAAAVTVAAEPTKVAKATSKLPAAEKKQAAKPKATATAATAVRQNAPRRAAVKA